MRRSVPVERTDKQLNNPAPSVVPHHTQVRRDNCLLVRRVVDTCLRKILIERDVPGAISYCKGVIAELLQNKMDISLLVITKVRRGISWRGERTDRK